VQVLVRQGDVQYQIRPDALNQRGELGDIVGIDCAGRDFYAVFRLDGGGDCLAFGESAAGEGDFAEGVFRLRAFGRL